MLQQQLSSAETPTQNLTTKALKCNTVFHQNAPFSQATLHELTVTFQSIQAASPTFHNLISSQKAKAGPYTPHVLGALPVAHPASHLPAAWLPERCPQASLGPRSPSQGTNLQAHFSHCVLSANLLS